MSGPPDPRIDVREGSADPKTLSLPEGVPLGPISIGRHGAWRVVAPGVLEEHGFLYFNGSDLFLQSTDMNSPLLADGTPISVEWTAVYAPCEIGVGSARLWFAVPEASAPAPAPFGVPETIVMSEDARTGRAAPQAPGRPRVQGNDNEEATRLQPIEAVAAKRSPRGAAPPALKRDPPSSTLKSASITAIEAAARAPPAPSFGAPQPAPPLGPPPAPPFGPPPQPLAAPAAKESWIGMRWREASGPKKALVVLMAPLLWAVWVIFTDKPPAPRPARPATSASTSPSTTPSTGSPSAPAEPAGEPPSAPGGSGPPAAKAAGSAAPSGSPATTGPRTPQREAADAVAAGAFDRAAKLYEDLAKAHPEVPAYAEAARIMKAKAGRR
jgi:hypothetical protein